MRASDTHWPSTKALSVYNVLQKTGCDLTADEIRDYLRDEFDPAIGDKYVATGILFLEQRGFVGLDGKRVTIRNRNGAGRGPRVVRTGDDKDLVIL